MFLLLQYSLLIIYVLMIADNFVHASHVNIAVKKYAASALLEHKPSYSLTVRQSLLYTAAVLNLFALLYLSCMFDLVFITNIVLALSCIFVDLFIAVKKLSKLNTITSLAKTDLYTSDQYDTNTEWKRYFSWRMIACITGFLYYLGGMLF